MKSGGKKKEELLEWRIDSSKNFSFRSFVSDAQHKFDIEIQFDGIQAETDCPTVTQHSSTNRKSKIPKFNRDGNSSTPAFIIEDRQVPSTSKLEYF